VLLSTWKRSHSQKIQRLLSLTNISDHVVERVDHVIFSSLWVINIQQVLLCDRLSSFQKWFINMSPIIGTHATPTPILNFTYQKPTSHDLPLSDRHISHIPKTQGAGSLIKAYISRQLIRNEIRTVYNLLSSRYTLSKKIIFHFPYL